jgi:hypothetical protein
VKPLPPHGTHARAIGRPSGGIPRCPCQPCRRAEYLYDRRRRYLKQTGRSLTVDPTPTRAHLLALVAEGVTKEDIATAAPCSRSVIDTILTREPKTIRRTTADRILAVRPEQQPSYRERRVDAIGSTRRVRALVAIGHSVKTIQVESGVNHTAMSAIVEGATPTLRPEVAAAVTRAYKTLVTIPGTSARSRNRAVKLGWQGPAAWGADIDDPAAQPEPDAAEPKPGKVEAAAIRAADVKWLAKIGVAEDDIAARVGISVKYVRGQLGGHRAPGWREQVSA